MSFNRKANVLRRLVLCLAATLATVGAATAQNPVIVLSKVVNGHPVNVLQVVRSIEDQTDFLVSYNKNSLDPAREVDLPSAAMPLSDLLASVTRGIPVRSIVQGNYIAFVPSADNLSPQGRGAAPRTRDNYVQSASAPDASPNPRPAAPAAPVAETPAPAPVVTATPEPAAPYYSDFRSLDSYNVIRNGRPRFAVKTNLLYGAAALTPNLAVEVALSPHSTVELSYSNNPWNHDAKLPTNKKLLHGIAAAEYRYWLCERFEGHFFGANALYSQYNVSSHDVPSMFEKEYRYEGYAYGGGVTYGYALPIGRRWNVEFTAGVGVLQMEYDRYSCQTCDLDATAASKTWFGPTNLGINLVFLIK